MQHLNPLKKYFWKYRHRLLVGILFVIVSNYFAILSPQLTGYIIHFVQSTLDATPLRPTQTGSYDILIKSLIAHIENRPLTLMGKITLCGIVLLGLALLRSLFMFLMRQSIIVASRYIEYEQKNEIYNHYQKLELGFFKQNKTGDLMSRITEDVGKVRMLCGPGVMYFVNLFVVIAFSVYFMFRRDALLTVYVLSPLPLLAYIIYKVNISIHKQSEELQAGLSTLTSIAQESYSGIRVIKSFVQEKAQILFFQKNSEAYRQNAIALAKTEALYFPSISFLMGVSTLLTIMMGGLYYINGARGIGIDTIVEFVLYVNMLTFPVSAIGLTASMLQRASASQKRINEFLDIQPGIQSAPSAPDAGFSEKIVFENVNLKYPDTGIVALSNINLVINKGEKIAIMGNTGSGKTTLAQLLLRIVEPTSGRVLFDNKNITDLNLASLRKLSAYVLQDCFLFSDTIKNNIQFAEKITNENRVEQAAKMACIHNEIMELGQGYDTPIGERGITLSGGQKQRVSIARALMRDAAELLIFDDCLSALDTKTEKQILENLNQYMGKKTTLAITHRISAGIRYDKIIVLEKGCIIEQGTHEELLKLDGYYASLYRRQMEQG